MKILNVFNRDMSLSSQQRISVKLLVPQTRIISNDRVVIHHLNLSQKLVQNMKERNGAKLRSTILLFRTQGHLSRRSERYESHLGFQSVTQCFKKTERFSVIQSMIIFCKVDG